MACVSRERAVLADPPAESPSTIKISHFSGSLLEQSANLPGRAMPSKAVLRLVKSLALRAAARALCAITDFSQILFAALGFCSKK